MASSSSAGIGTKAGSAVAIPWARSTTVGYGTAARPWLSKSAAARSTEPPAMTQRANAAVTRPPAGFPSVTRPRPPAGFPAPVRQRPPASFPAPGHAADHRREFKIDSESREMVRKLLEENRAAARRPEAVAAREQWRARVEEVERRGKIENRPKEQRQVASGEQAEVPMMSS